MQCVVTGAAGFIGSHLCERLLALGHEVIGLDAFVPYYPRAVKERNLAGLRGRPGFRFHCLDLRSDPLDDVVADAEAVFHLAAMPGLVKSWTDFDGYNSCNVVATQRLLEALRQAPRLRRLVHVSTSSVYGRFAAGDETMPTIPVSPYGVTKLAAEHLCRAYADAYRLPVVILRYFSVYGPRQRPDMGYHIFMDALLHDRPITVYGDGRQERGNTYVADAVEAAVVALGAPPGEVFNGGGGETASVLDVAPPAGTGDGPSAARAARSRPARRPAADRGRHRQAAPARLGAGHPARRRTGPRLGLGLRGSICALRARRAARIGKLGRRLHRLNNDADDIESRWGAEGRTMRREPDTLRGVIIRMAETRSGAPFLFSPETTGETTFAELRRRSERLAQWLLARGLSKGDKVAFLMDNGLFTAELFLGAMYGGFTVVPLNVRAGAPTSPIP